MIYNTYRAKSVTGETRKILLVRNFLGVDLSTDRNLVSNNRAIYSNNYLLKDGCVQKRKGREQLFHFNNNYKLLEVSFDGTLTSNIVSTSSRINGIYSFIGEDGETHLVAHIGCLLFQLSSYTDDAFTLSPIYADSGTTVLNGVTYHHVYVFNDFNSMKSMFVGKKMLWFANGSKFVVIRALSSGGIVIQPVADNSDITFVPTTMTEITYADAITSGRNALDDPNLLTKWRKNQLLSGIGKLYSSNSEKKVTQFYEYTLSEPIVCQNEAKDMADFSIVINERGESD